MTDHTCTHLNTKPISVSGHFIQTSNVNIIDPAFAFFRQLSRSERENRIIELKVMREVSEEIDQPR